LKLDHDQQAQCVANVVSSMSSATLEGRMPGRNETRSPAGGTLQWS